VETIDTIKVSGETIAETTEDKTSPELVGNQELQRKYTGNWLWRSIATLMEISESQPSPKWIANRLRVSLGEVVDAMDGLEKIKIIRRTQTGFEKNVQTIYFSDRDLDARSLLADHVLITTQLNGRMDPLDPQGDCFYRTSFIASNKASVRKFNKKIELAMLEFLRESETIKADTVYGVTFSSVDVASKEKGIG